mgnify:CR=1 FL=1
MTSISRRAALGLSVGTLGWLAAPRWTRAQAGKVFRFAPHAALRVLDPVSTPAYVTRNHGYMIYDQLFAVDANYVPRPQMVQDWEVSADRLSYTFRLRDGLKFHDGAPVTAEDCVASIMRWAKRDVVGLRMAAVTKAMTAQDERTFRIDFNEPFGAIFDALSKISSIPLFVMPKRIADTPPEKALEEVIGSGPFKWVAGEFDPGVRWSYERNTDYVARDEPPNGLAGGKVVNMDRFEVIYFPNNQTAINALQNGEIDAIESFGADQLSIIEGDNRVVTSPTFVPNAPTIRFNWALPPFNDVMARRAVQAAVTQRDFLEARVGDPAHFRLCGSFFGCGTPLESDIGVVDRGQPDMEKAKALMAQSSYKGETVVLLNPSELESFQPFVALTTQALTDLGMKVEIQNMDWATFLKRRTVSAPVSEGGWNIANAIFSQLDLNSPLANPNFDARGAAGYTGFVDDPEIERLKTEFQKAGSDAERKAIADKIQLRGHEEVVYIPLGNYFDYSGARPEVKRLQAPLYVGWGLEL